MSLFSNTAKAAFRKFGQLLIPTSGHTAPDLRSGCKVLKGQFKPWTAFAHRIPVKYFIGRFSVCVGGVRERERKEIIKNNQKRKGWKFLLKFPL